MEHSEVMIALFSCPAPKCCFIIFQLNLQDLYSKYIHYAISLIWHFKPCIFFSGKTSPNSLIWGGRSSVILSKMQVWSPRVCWQFQPYLPSQPLQKDNFTACRVNNCWTCGTAENRHFSLTKISTSPHFCWYQPSPLMIFMEVSIVMEGPGSSSSY